jgi:hypothetical protein
MTKQHLGRAPGPRENHTLGPVDTQSYLPISTMVEGSASHLFETPADVTIILLQAVNHTKTAMLRNNTIRTTCKWTPLHCHQISSEDSLQTYLIKHIN